MEMEELPSQEDSSWLYWKDEESEEDEEDEEDDWA